jgi:phosphoglycolate phosphatase-like HAD superfamily hydrolase
MIKNIIFDYDGTIADSVNIKTEAFAELYRNYGKDIESKVVKYHLNNGGVSRFEKFKYYHKEFLNIDLDEGKIQELAQKFSKLVTNKVVHSPYIPGAFEFISNNYKKYNMFISTATPTDEIKEILSRKNLTLYFKDIKGSPESKVAHVKQIISNNNYFSNETVYIGDSGSDKDAAHHNEISFIAISNTNKFQNERFLMPDLIDFELLLNKMN